MTKTELMAFRHPSEGSRFWISMIVVVPILTSAIVLVFASLGTALFGVAAIVFGLWVSMKILTARLLGNTVKVSPDNFPEIDAAVTEYKELFGYPGRIDVYVYDGESFNAMLLPLLRRKYILIHSNVISDSESENEVRWIVARFVGALASKHYRFSWLQAVIGSIEKIMIFNMLLYPYERAVIKSGDQLGLVAINGDIESAVRASHRLMIGGTLGDRVSLAGVLRQHEAISGSFFGWLAKCLSPFPHTTARIANLLRMAGERYPLQLQALLAGKDEAMLALVLRAVNAEFPAPVSTPAPAAQAV